MTKKNIDFLNLLIKHIKSYTYAINGIKILLHEVNFLVELLILIVLLITQLVLHIRYLIFASWIILWLLLVSAESFNTAIEALADFVHNEPHKQIKNIKDLSAFGVLLIAISLFISYLLGISMIFI